jgi:hypothetical protein
MSWRRGLLRFHVAESDCDLAIAHVVLISTKDEHDCRFEHFLKPVNGLTPALLVDPSAIAVQNAIGSHARRACSRRWEFGDNIP